MSGYIGTQPVPQATQTRDAFTCTAGQTSFATSGYTPQFLDVYLNGIFLNNGSDYTASNGSDVILTSGAAADDILEVVAYTTFEVASQTFTGTTTVDVLSVTGAATGTDLTLSGGVYLGGTGSANKLDDYEEGTWTPVLVGASGTPSHTVVSSTGYYVRVGNLVHVSMDWYATFVSGGAGDYYFTGLPFARDMNVPGPTGPARFYQVGGYNPAVAIYGGTALAPFVSSGATNSTWRWGVVGDITGTSIVAASISYQAV